MPFFEISGEIFETEYGPITEKEVFEAIDDMTAFYILSEGDFSDVRLQRLEEIGMEAAHRSLRKSVRSGVGVVALPISLIPGPGGLLARKTTSAITSILELGMGSNASDAYMRSQVKKEIRDRVRKEVARQEGRSS
jgi:hypothetical protein